jgi:hypothetical protein
MTLRGLVDELVDQLRAAAGRGGAGVDLRGVTAWTAEGVRAMSALLDRDGTVRVLAARPTPFLELLRDADLMETWSLYRQIRQILGAARPADRPDVAP